VKVGLFPMKVGHRTEGSLRFIKAQKPRVFSLTEMDLGSTTYLPLVHRVLGRLSRIFSADKGGHSQEIPIVLRLAIWIKVVSYDLIQLSDDGGDAVGGMGNDRWAGRLKIKVWRKVWVLWATHLDAGVQHVAAGPDLGTLLKTEAGRLRWTRYQQEIQKLYNHVAIDIGDSNVDVVVVQGDLNMLPIADGVTDPHSPVHLFHKRLGMDFVNARVGYIFVHGAKIRKTRTYPPGQNGWGSDHAGILSWIR
jgi:hypothetical protein